MPLHQDEVRDGERSSSEATPLQDQTKKPVKREPPHGPSRRSLRGLDWFVFFVADVQTGFDVVDDARSRHRSAHRVIVVDESHEGSRPDANYHDRF
jgi:hypothetical protein